jgi:molybdopterin/thiamine biosynthesis adenylyltransferase
MAVIFGVGSIGSNVGGRLAEAGLGRLRLVDGEILRPGNLVRHLADFGVGASKALATEFQIDASAPWTKVERVLEQPWSPTRLTELLADADVAIDATGMATFAELLGRVALQAGVPLVSTALYRGGYIGRVRRQRPGADTPLSERTDENRFPLIPSGDEPVSLEAGCSAPVNNASPISVAAIAATTALVVVDLLSERLDYGAELIDIFRPLEGEPFDHVGRLCG